MVFFFTLLSLISSVIGSCPDGTMEYGNVCYIFLNWHEVAYIRKNVWKEGPKLTFPENYKIPVAKYYLVTTPAEAMRFCDHIKDLKDDDTVFTLSKTLKPNWTYIANNVRFRLPTPTSEAHLGWLWDKAEIYHDLYDASPDYERGRMWLGAKKADIFNWVRGGRYSPNKGYGDHYQPLWKAVLGPPGECVHLYKSKYNPTSRLTRWKYNGLYFINCKKGLFLNTNNSADDSNSLNYIDNYIVGCEFDMPMPCVEEFSKMGCAVKWEGEKSSCMKARFYKVLQEASPLSPVKCTPQGTLTNDECENDNPYAGACKKDCKWAWADWTACSPCRKNRRGRGSQIRSPEETVRASFGGKECVNKPAAKTRNCTCPFSKSCILKAHKSFILGFAFGILQVTAFL